MATDKKFYIQDLYLAAYLQLSGIIPDIETTIHGKVLFSFPQSDKLYTLTNLYNAGAASIPSVLDFINVMRTLRARMNEAKMGGVR